MPFYYSRVEFADIIFVYSFCDGNSRAAVKEYGRRFPNRRIPAQETFTRVFQFPRDHGIFQQWEGTWNSRLEMSTVKISWIWWSRIQLKVQEGLENIKKRPNASLPPAKGSASQTWRWNLTDKFLSVDFKSFQNRTEDIIYGWSPVYAGRCNKFKEFPHMGKRKSSCHGTKALLA